MTSKMKKNIAVVGIEIPNDYQWKKMPVTDQINLVKSRIKTLYTKIKSDDPNSVIIFSWRDNGIVKGDEDGLNKTEKDFFKITMQELTSTHQDLIIVSGPIYTTKQVKKADIGKLLQSYEDHAWVEEREEKKAKLPNFPVEKQKIENAMHSDQDEFKVRRLTSYIFYESECERRGKLMPYGETSLDNVLFKIPKKDKGSDAVIDITLSDGFSIPIAIEICREHVRGALKHNPNTDKPIPLIQFILSNTAQLAPSNLVGHYSIHLDDREPFSAINLAANEDEKIDFFTHDLMGWQEQDELLRKSPALNVFVYMAMQLIGIIELAILTNESDYEKMNLVKFKNFLLEHIEEGYADALTVEREINQLKIPEKISEPTNWFANTLAFFNKNTEQTSNSLSEELKLSLREIEKVFHSCKTALTNNPSPAKIIKNPSKLDK